MKLFVAALALLAAACSPAAPKSQATPESGLGPATERGVSAARVEGIWVFNHDPNGGSDALHTGIATIEDGCLLVDGAAVIWHADDLGIVSDIVAAVLAGAAPQLSIGGGGVSRFEAADPAHFPAIVLERCPVETIWYASGD